MTKFKDQFTFEERKAESEKILNKYPTKCPIILDVDNSMSFIKAEYLKEPEKTKFLCPKELSMGSFLQVVRKKIEVDEKIGIFLFVGGKVLVPVGDTLETVYEKYKDEDGFLYIIVCCENVFG